MHGPLEVVRGDRLGICGKRQAMVAPQIEGYPGCSCIGSGQCAFVHPHDDEMFMVHGPCFQKTHHLETLKGLAEE